MFDIGGGLQELVLIFVIALLVFGPKNLPQFARAVARAMREFRRASDEFRSTIETHLKINEPDPGPETPPASTHSEAMPVAAPATEAVPVPVLNAYHARTTPIPEGEPYVAQRGAKLVHGRDCDWAKRIPEAERVYFKRVADAKEATLSACPVCAPSESP